jgi:hypothetical protein
MGFYRMTQGDIDETWREVLKHGSGAVTACNCPVANCLKRYGFKGVSVRGDGIIYIWGWDRGPAVYRQPGKLSDWISDFDSYASSPEAICPMDPISFGLPI